MKSIFKFSSFILGALLFLTSCEKAEELPYYQESNATQLSASAGAVTITAANANQDVVTFSWTDAVMATDSANQKYIIDIAPKGSNFANPISYTVYGVQQLSVKGVDINNYLVKLGANYGATTELEARCVSSYRNNNDRKVSNSVALTASAYAVPFTVAANGVGPFEPTIATKDNELAKLTWAAPNYGTATLSYILEYVLNGMAFTNPKTIAIEAGKLEKGLTGMELYQIANTAGVPMGTTGKADVRIKAVVAETNQTSYSNILTLSIKPVEMTLYMYVPGDHQGWDPTTAPRIASTDGVSYEGYIWVGGGSGEFKLTPAPNWDLSYGGDATTISTSGGNLKFPATGAMYLLKVNMQTKAWSVVRTDWKIIGGATPGGWDNATPMTYDAATGKWKITVAATAGEFKFRANDNWDLSLGAGADGFLTSTNGGNLSITAGTKTITLDLNNPPKYTYIIQ